MKSQDCKRIGAQREWQGTFLEKAGKGMILYLELEDAVALVEDEHNQFCIVERALR